MESSDTSQLNKFYSIKPKVINLKPYTPFSSLKSNISGQLVSLCGHVIRVSAAQPYVTFGIFKCSKCQSLTKQTFVDGIFQPPTQCSTPKYDPRRSLDPYPLTRCKNRYLDFLRSQAITSDFQKIKIQEYIDPDSTADPSRAEDEEGTTIAPNVPRTFEAELRGEELVDSCVSGDLVVMVGIVKAVQQVTSPPTLFDH
jgi:DNA replicative helicase MCM subunit Mcm2 (Cdc46/Mcm family)